MQFISAFSVTCLCSFLFISSTSTLVPRYTRYTSDWSQPAPYSPKLPPPDSFSSFQSPSRTILDWPAYHSFRLKFPQAYGTLPWVFCTQSRLRWFWWTWPLSWSSHFLVLGTRFLTWIGGSSWLGFEPWYVRHRYWVCCRLLDRLLWICFGFCYWIRLRYRWLWTACPFISTEWKF